MSDLHIPRSVQDAVYRQTENLRSAARQTLTLASVIGRRFDFSMLQQLENILGLEPSISSDAGLSKLF